MFIELGSSEKEWNDSSGGKIIAKTILDTIKKDVPKKETYIALGGIHYPQNFNKILLETDLAISHICPKYLLSALNEELLKQAFNKSVEKCSGAIVDWKGMGNQKGRVLNLLALCDIPYRKASEFV